ncbi:hypothetical protein, partial [Ferranicluibacter rubi]|uniref:hypothetical protein n=1 Tax=Ferranicluibacter rubi TaxID=2715133 RepID=UPI00248C0584
VMLSLPFDFFKFDPEWLVPPAGFTLAEPKQKVNQCLKRFKRFSFLKSIVLRIFCDNRASADAGGQGISGWTGLYSSATFAGRFLAGG